MNPARLLAHFDRMADAPDAIPRLRRFVLDLAVRGKLVEQNPNDEPAAKLLKRIEVGKSQFMKGQKPYDITSLSRDEAPFAIPPRWVWVRFGDVVFSRDAERIPVSKEERSARAKNYDYYGASGVIDKIDSFLFDKPLLLIGEDGANLVNRSTPIAFIARGKYWVNNHAHVLDGISEESLRYLELHINAIDLKPYVTGTAQPKMNQAKMNSIPIALPPEPEQLRIIAKVDELMALCDKLEAAQTERESRRDRLICASLNRLNELADDAGNFRDHARFTLDNLPRLSTLPEHVPQLRQTILNLAIRGMLVPQDQRDEPASELVARVNREKERMHKAGSIRKPSEHTPLTEHEKPFDVPAGWQWVRFGQVINDSDAGWSPVTESFPRSGDNWGVIKVSAVTWDRFLACENKQLLPGAIPPEGTEIRKNDFLISRANTSELVAKCVVVEEEPVKLTLSDKTVRLDIAKECNRYFLRLVNNHATHARAYYAEQASGTSLSMKNVSRPVIYSLLIPLPPLAEQHRIVAKVDELMALCDRLESQLTTTQTESRRLLEAVLHEALEPVA